MAKALNLNKFRKALTWMWDLGDDGIWTGAWELPEDELMETHGHWKDDDWIQKHMAGEPIYFRGQRLG